MMKDGKVVAEKQEILDEEGNILKTEVRAVAPDEIEQL